MVCDRGEVPYVYVVSLDNDAPESTHLYGNLNRYTAGALNLEDVVYIGCQVGGTVTNTNSYVRISPDGWIDAGIANCEPNMYNNYKLRVGD